MNAWLCYILLFSQNASAYVNLRKQSSFYTYLLASAAAEEIGCVLDEKNRSFDIKPLQYR
mgnify:CR=1 FL=1